jgi:hypothetical protein
MDMTRIQELELARDGAERLVEEARERLQEIERRIAKESGKRLAALPGRGRGFKSLTDDQRREVARMGGLAAQKNGTAHRFDSKTGTAAALNSAGVRRKNKRVSRREIIDFLRLRSKAKRPSIRATDLQQRFQISRPAAESHLARLALSKTVKRIDVGTYAFGGGVGV